MKVAIVHKPTYRITIYLINGNLDLYPFLYQLFFAINTIYCNIMLSFYHDIVFM